MYRGGHTLLVDFFEEHREEVVEVSIYDAVMEAAPDYNRIKIYTKCPIPD